MRGWRYGNRGEARRTLYLGLTIDERYGGTEVDMLSYALVCEELGRGDSSVRGIVSVSLGLVAKTIAAYGTDEQKQQWLPRLTSVERSVASR